MVLSECGFVFDPAVPVSFEKSFAKLFFETDVYLFRYGPSELN